MIPGEPTTTATHTLAVQDPPVQVAFASDMPSIYQQGSGQAIPFIVDGTMPSDGSVLVAAWSYDKQQMIDAFAMKSSPRLGRSAPPSSINFPPARCSCNSCATCPAWKRRSCVMTSTCRPRPSSRRRCPRSASPVIRQRRINKARARRFSSPWMARCPTARMCAPLHGPIRSSAW